MENDTAELDNVDEAAKAFGKLRREVTTMRLAIEQLVDEPNRIEIPDYTETLADMSDRIAGMSKRLKSIWASPAMELTPEIVTRQILAARKETQAAERASLDEAKAALDKATQTIAAYVLSAQTAEKQNKWLFGFGALTFVVGIIVTATFLKW